MPALIELTPDDVRCLRELARRKVAACGGASASRQQDGSSPEDSNLRGLAGQLACARYWPQWLGEADVWSDNGSLGHRPDFWVMPERRLTVDVKTVRGPNHRLAMHAHQGQPRDDFYILVRPGLGPRQLAIAGWQDRAGFLKWGGWEELRVGQQWVLPNERLQETDLFRPVPLPALASRPPAPAPCRRPPRRLQGVGFFGPDAEYYWWLLHLYRAGRDISRIGYWAFKKEQRRK